MKVYYYIQGTGKGVPADNPIDPGFEGARRILNSLHGTGSFLGLDVSCSHTIQFYTEEGSMWIEVLHVPEKMTVGCKASLPIAELALEAAYQGRDVREALHESGFDWLEWHQEYLTA